MTKQTDSAVLKQALERAGLKLTLPRELVFLALARAGAPLSAAELARKLKAQGIGAATVFRTLALLTRLRLAERVQQGRSVRYLHLGSGHRHPLVCRGCGGVVQFEACELSLLERLLAKETGYTIEGHRLELYGTCPRCQHKGGGNK